METLNTINNELSSEGYSEFKIIAIGKDDYSHKNNDWTTDNNIAIVIDNTNNTTWNNWGAYKRSLFFLDFNQQLVQIMSVVSDDDMDENQIKELIISLIENNS